MKGLDEIVSYLQESIADEVLSKTEKRTLKDLVAGYQPDDHQLNVLRSKIYDMAPASMRKIKALSSIGYDKPTVRCCLPRLTRPMCFLARAKPAAK